MNQNDTEQYVARGNNRNRLKPFPCMQKDASVETEESNNEKQRVLPDISKQQLRAVAEGQGRFRDINTAFLGLATLALAIMAALLPATRSRARVWSWVAILFGVLASIIVAWFSRQREFRADAGAALAALVVGVLLIVAGYKMSLGYTWHGVPWDEDCWLHRVGGAALLVLGGFAIGSLPFEIVKVYLKLVPVVYEGVGDQFPVVVGG